MNPILRNVLSVLGGCFIGGLANITIISISPFIIPWPEGIIPTDPESLKAGADLLETKHFIMPFIAHAAGTFIGAYVAARYAANRQLLFGILIGFYFLIGGITMINVIPAPTWFTALDLLVAYLPMGYLGGILGLKANPLKP